MINDHGCVVAGVCLAVARRSRQASFGLRKGQLGKREGDALQFEVFRCCHTAMAFRTIEQFVLLGTLSLGSVKLSMRHDS